MGILRGKSKNKDSVNAKKARNKKTLKEKISMYDMILANLVAGSSIIEPEEELNNSEISIGFSDIASNNMIAKYFVITNFPDWIYPKVIDTIRSKCILRGVKIDFYIYGQPHKINWNSAEMKNRMSIWRNYAEKTNSNVNVFDYRLKRDAALTKERIVMSTKYLNESELEHRRTLNKVTFLVVISGKRDNESILNLGKSIKMFKGLCNSSDIKFRELKINMIDWIQYFGIFSLRNIPEVVSKVPKKIMTDDVLANFNSYKQGRVGSGGVPLGMDVLSMVPVLKKFKEDPDAPENWLISAATGGGKSYFVKPLILYLIASSFVVTALDYEGDEYNNIANYIAASNPEDVKIISIGKGSTIYFDPMEIAQLTGDEDIDDELKETAVQYTLALFRIVNCGIEGKMSREEEKLISTAIKRVYDCVGVTEDKSTWGRSKGLRVSMVYEELKDMMESKEFVDELTDNTKHKALVKIVDNSSIYFEEGESKAGTFKNAMSVNELFRAKFIVFSFGMRGADTTQIDPVILALRQMSVANVSIQISNYCKYVRKCFNVKIWEEYQRWGDIQGSADIIVNAMTGGRKRGDVNFIITNVLSSILDDDNEVNKKLRQNIQYYAIGSIPDKDVREEFCEKFSLKELEGVLANIAKASNVQADSISNKSSSLSNRYKHAFCVVLNNGKKAVVKVMLPPELRRSKMFKTGVDVGK